MQSSNPFSLIHTFVYIVFGRIVPLMFVIGGLLFLFVGTWNLYRGYSSKNWPTTDGNVVSTEIQTVRRRDSDRAFDTDYRLLVRYRYVVQGNEYQSHQLRFGSMVHDEQAAAKEQQKRYPRGKAVEVHYDPDNPSVAVLLPGVGAGGWVAMILGLVNALIGLGLLVWLPRLLANRSMVPRSPDSSDAAATFNKQP